MVHVLRSLVQVLQKNQIESILPILSPIIVSQKRTQRVGILRRTTNIARIEDVLIVIYFHMKKKIEKRYKEKVDKI